MKKEQNYYLSFLSGGLAGCTAKSLIAPFDRVKLLFLVRDRRFNYKAAYSDFTYICQHHGLQSLWRGNSATLLRVFPYAAIQYVSVDYFINQFQKPISNQRYILKKFMYFLCGAMAGITSTVSTYPLELLRTRLGMEKTNFNYNNLRHASLMIYKDQGLYGFYQGVHIAVLGIIPYVGTTFLLYNVVKGEVSRLYPLYYNNPIGHFIYGGFAGLCGQLIAYPFDIVRKRLQGQRLLVIKGEIAYQLKTIELIKHIKNNEGVVRGFYKGISLNFFKGPLAVGTSLSVKNLINRNVDKNYE